MESSHNRRQRIYLQQRILRHSVFCHFTLLHFFCLSCPVFTRRLLKSPFRRFRSQTAKSSVYRITTSASIDTSRSLSNMRTLPYDLIHPLPVIPLITNFLLWTHNRTTLASNPWPHGCAPGSPARTLLRLPRCLSSFQALLSGCPGKINCRRSRRSLHNPTRTVRAPNYPTSPTSGASCRRAARKAFSLVTRLG